MMHLYQGEMSSSAPSRTHSSPSEVKFEGRTYPLLWEPAGWRLRSKSKTHPVDYRTGSKLIGTAKTLALEWLRTHGAKIRQARKGGGTLETLARLYLAAPKRTQAHVAQSNVTRLRSICRTVFNRELDAVTCKEVGPMMWEEYQRRALAAKGLPFDYAVRRPENIAINAAVRAAKCLFLPSLLSRYGASGIEPNSDCSVAVYLPEPEPDPAKVREFRLLRAWMKLQSVNYPLWMALGLARCAGLRRDEALVSRVGWIEERKRRLVIHLRDRSDEQFHSKTGVGYVSEVIGQRFTAHLRALQKEKGPDEFLIPEPGSDRARWIERAPQVWLRKHGLKMRLPYHQLRKLYATAVAQRAGSLVAQEAAGMKAAQRNLGHTTQKATRSYVSR